MELKDIMVSVFPNVKIKDNPEHLPLLEILEIIRKEIACGNYSIRHVRKDGR